MSDRSDSYQNKHKYHHESTSAVGGVSMDEDAGGFVRRLARRDRNPAIAWVASLFLLSLVVTASFFRGRGSTVAQQREQTLRIADVEWPPAFRHGHPTAHHKHKTTENRKNALLDAVKQTGIDVASDGSAIVWKGEHGGKIKPVGPLRDKRIGIILASEFSDFQVYYLASYIGELGGTCEFLLVDWVKWKLTRPNVSDKGVRGMWDISVDPMPVMASSDKAAHYGGLRDADPGDYDAIIIVGGHSADVMTTEADVVEFIRAAEAGGAVLGTIGAGSMPLIAAGIMHGRECTGNWLVDYMLKKIANFRPVPVVTDGKLITARDTVDTPAFVRALSRTFDPDFDDARKGAMLGARVMLLIGEDYEDIEVIVPVLEWIYRGADVLIGRFDPQFTSRAPHASSDFAVGNFGTTIPFQEIPDDLYSIKKLEDVSMTDFDVVVITGAFNPWNIVATGTSEWLKKAHAAGKFIAAVCHGPIPVAAADLVKGKKLTGWLASRDSVEIMGGTFNSDEWAAVIDGWLISARTPPELPEFIDAINVALLL